MAEMMKDRPAYVRFEKRAVEDRTQSMAKGHWVGRDVVYALVQSPGSKDVLVVEADPWIERLRKEEVEGRIPGPFVDAYERAYEKYKKGEELPPEGTPIKGWPPLSPAQQGNLIAMNILTVEDLAGLNAEGMARFGMGIVELKNRAKNWLEAAHSIGGVVATLTALQTDHDQLKQQNARQIALIQKLQARLEALEKVPA